MMNNESDKSDYDATSDYNLRQEAGEIEIYRRYLSTLDYANPKNLNGSAIFRDYAKLLFTVNSSFDDANESLSGDEIFPRTVSYNYFARSTAVLTILTVIYLGIFVAGVLGNVVTCIVIAKNKSMHTAVNYYLFSLAISDLCLLITALPDEVYMLWNQEYPFNENVCKFHKFAAESFTNATVFTITAFTIERYVAICKPFLSHTLSKLSRAYKFILFIWVISVCLAVPQTLFTLHLDETFRICIPKAEHVHFFVVSTFLLFVIPMSIITILYILIGLQLRKSKIVQRGAVNGSSVRLKRKIFKNPAKHQTLVTVNCESHYNEALIHQQQQQQQLQHQHRAGDINKNFKANNLIEQENSIPEDGRINYSNNRAQVHHGSRHVVNMLVVVVIAFFICWLPFHIQRLLFSYIDPGVLTDNESFVVNSVSGVLFFVSTCINPFLYNIMSNKFREAFKVTIAKYIYSTHLEKCPSSGGKGLFRTISQRSYSMNSTSLNTCSSVCSMQPFSAQNPQQLTFRYFDSKRPLVVSFRRVNKMTQNNFTLEHCGSMNDFHRVGIGTGCGGTSGAAGSSYGLNAIKCGKDNGGHKYGNRNGIMRSYENQSCRNFNYFDKSRAHFEVQYDDDEDDYDEDDGTYRNDRITITYPKEKFYGNAKLLFTPRNAINENVNQLYEEILRKQSIAQHDDGIFVSNGQNHNNNNGAGQFAKNKPAKRHTNKSFLINANSQTNLSEFNGTRRNFLHSKFAKMFNSRNDVHFETRVNFPRRKCASIPSLYKISHFPNTLDMNFKQATAARDDSDIGKKSCVSALNVGGTKETFQVRTSKSC